MMTKDLNKIYIIVNGQYVSVAAFLAIDKMTVRTVDASGCTALTALVEKIAAATE